MPYVFLLPSTYTKFIRRRFNIYCKNNSYNTVSNKWYHHFEWLILLTGIVDIKEVILTIPIKWFVCLKLFVQLENFSLIWRRHHCWWRAANFDLCSALMAIEQWGFFSVPHLLWHGTSVYNGHPRDTHT